MIDIREIRQDSAPRPWVSRLDPRAKILSTLFFLVFVLLAKGFSSLLILAFFLIIFYLAAGCSYMSVLRGLKPFWWLLAATFLLNLVLTPGRILIDFWWLSVTYQGLLRGTLLSLRLVLAVSGAHLLLSTTAPLELSDGLVKLVSPLRFLKLPVSEIGSISSLALRFVPAVREELDRILSAQKARGGLGRGARARIRGVLPLIHPLLSSCLRRGESVSLALEARGYRPGVVYTKNGGLRLDDFVTMGTVWAVGFTALGIGFWLG